MEKAVIHPSRLFQSVSITDIKDAETMVISSCQNRYGERRHNHAIH
jgi:hypothetical protein